MMSVKRRARKLLAETMIPKLQQRGMEGYYADTKEEALELVKEMMKTPGVVAWGGSASLKEAGVFDYLQESNHTLIDRYKAENLEEEKQVKAATVNADYYLMSSNAITQDGILVNIDGYGNRVASLCYGPETVVIVAGMNKVEPDLDAAVKRVRNIASPPNAIRLKKDTPCAKLGRCGNCLTDDCLCCQVVVTRNSREKNRIKVILVGDDLGF